MQVLVYLVTYMTQPLPKDEKPKSTPEERSCRRFQDRDIRRSRREGVEMHRVASDRCGSGEEMEGSVRARFIQTIHFLPTVK